jgi:uncharacterized protein (DUF302 family)
MVHRAADKETAMDPVYEKPVQGSLEEVESRVAKAVQDRGYGLLGSIDLREKMRGKGLDFAPACRVYEVCSPVRAKKVLERDMSISTALPCRISLYESGGRLHLATLRPTTILGAFGRTELEGEARQVEEDLVAIIDEVAAAR